MFCNKKKALRSQCVRKTGQSSNFLGYDDESHAKYTWKNYEIEDEPNLRRRYVKHPSKDERKSEIADWLSTISPCH